MSLTVVSAFRTSVLCQLALCRCVACAMCRVREIFDESKLVNAEVHGKACHSQMSQCQDPFATSNNEVTRYRMG